MRAVFVYMLVASLCLFFAIGAFFFLAPSALPVVDGPRLAYNLEELAQRNAQLAQYKTYYISIGMLGIGLILAFATTLSLRNQNETRAQLGRRNMLILTSLGATLLGYALLTDNLTAFLLDGLHALDSPHSRSGIELFGPILIIAIIVLALTVLVRYIDVSDRTTLNSHRQSPPPGA